MDTVDKVAPKRGRPAKEDAATPVGQYQIEQARLARESKDKNPVVEKWYELIGTKLCLIKKKKSGKTLSEFIGNVAEVKGASEHYKQHREKLLIEIKKLESEGRLKRRL
jgi:hypothetical protein